LGYRRSALIDLLKEESEVSQFADECNIVYGWHAYGSIGIRNPDKGDYVELIRSVKAKQIALIATEVGYITMSGSGSINAARERAFNYMLELGPTFDVGLLWWHATGDSTEESTFSLKQDGSGFWSGDSDGGLTEGGTLFWNFSQDNESIRRFRGNVSVSGCPSSN